MFRLSSAYLFNNIRYLICVCVFVRGFCVSRRSSAHRFQLPVVMDATHQLVDVDRPENIFLVDSADICVLRTRLFSVCIVSSRLADKQLSREKDEKTTMALQMGRE